jgi:para-nitrobenzyl esterase
MGLRRRGETLGSQVAAAYPISAFDSPQDALERVTGDVLLVCSTHDTAKRAADAGLSVFMYNFARPIPIPALASLDLRATHGAEIAYVFGSVGPDLVGEDDLALSVTMRRHWGQFASSGDPNLGGGTAWPAFSSTSDVRLNFDVSLSTVDDFRSDVCAFWESVYDQDFD